MTDHIETLKEEVADANKTHGGNTLRSPLVYSGSLDKYNSFASTTVIGQEFPDVQLTELLNAPNADELLRDLAVTVSQRGVVFFRNQDITSEQQRVLIDKLGKLTGKPDTSKLHIHPTTWSGSELGDELTDISSERFDEHRRAYAYRSDFSSNGWHTDISFEKAPSDYAILKLVEVPETGGDTLWASGYDVYDRLSKPYKQFAESLLAYHSGEQFKSVAALLGKDLRTERGSPDNQGLDLDSVHPLVRTNPVTGWKSIYVSASFTKFIADINRAESDLLIQYILKLFSENHDLQVRFKWNKNDIAIWDNRSVLHTATPDVVGARAGRRAVSLGEKPYFDSSSRSRREDLGLPEWSTVFGKV